MVVHVDNYFYKEKKKRILYKNYEYMYEYFQEGYCFEISFLSTGFKNNILDIKVI